MMQKKLKSTVVVPILILASMTFLYLLRILSVNFTPRMFSYPVLMEDIQSSGNSLSFDVKSTENYLGILSIDSDRGITFGATGSLIFTLKDVENSEIVAKNSYRASDLQYISTFSFGLPVIDDSKDKVYRAVFELDCSGDCGKILTPDLVVLRHYFPKSLFITDPLLVSEYFGKKIIAQVGMSSAREIIEVIILPLTIYYLLLATYPYIRKNNPKLTDDILTIVRRSKVDKVLLSLLIIDVLIQKEIILLIILSVFMYKMSKYNLSTKFALTCVLLLFCFLLYVANLPYFSIRVGMWVFLCLVIVLFSRPEKSF